MKPEKQQLIQDILGDEGRRETTLLAGTQVLRRRRQRRAVTRCLALALAVTAMVLSLEQVKSRRLSVQTPSPVSPPTATVQPRSLTDDELLAIFPTNTPVGLITLADGKKRLIFPRPGDEKRFVIRL
ncbi:MAG: hypothetical protein ACLQAH_06380 [Limisphaerales bacterium]